MTGSSKIKHIAVAIGAAALAAAPAAAQAGIVEEVGSVQTEAGPVTIENVAGGLDHPWGMAFLPDGRLLVTERAGDLRILGTGGSASTAVGRGRLQDGRIEGFEVIFSQEPKITGPNHFGGRIVFSPESHLFLTMGERFQFEPAQDLSNHLGTIIRINRDGTVPEDNPFVGQADAEDEIWSYGHRNIESAAIHLETGALWIAEMGPLGGDELNRPEPGRNYGWPVVSWGINYDGTDIPDPPAEPRFADAVKHWTPVISPSGMVFYTGDVFPEWRGSALIGGLTASGIVRVEIDGQNVTGEERIPLGARIRDVEQGPDGFVYVLTDQDDGNVWRLTPLQ